MKYLQLFNDGLDSFKELSDDEAGKLIKAIISYNKDEEVRLKGALNALFMMFKNEIERNKETYENKCKANKANGLKGGRPKTQNNRTVKNETQKSQDKDKDKDKDKEIKNPYDLFLDDLKKQVSIKSKVTKTKEGLILFKSIKDINKLRSDYILHQVEKKEFAQRITAFLEDYNPSDVYNTNESLGGYKLA